MRNSGTGIGTRLWRGLAASGVVLGIVAASIVGLNALADDLAVHGQTAHASDHDVAEV